MRGANLADLVTMYLELASSFCEALVFAGQN